MTSPGTDPADLDDGWDEDEIQDPDEHFTQRLAQLGPEATGTFATDPWPHYHTSAAQRLEAARQLKWQAPSRATSVILAMVTDGDLEDEDRLEAIRTAIEVGPAAHRAALWLLDRIDFAFSDTATLYRAQELAGNLTPGSNWWEAYALLATSQDLDEAVRFEAAATLANEAPGQAAYLAIKSWFPPERLPDLALRARDDVLGADAVLDRVVADADLATTVRIDAAETLTMDPDTPDAGLRYLLDMLGDEAASREDRLRALEWLDDTGSPFSDQLNALVRERFGLEPATERWDSTATDALLANYRRELARSDCNP